MKAKARYGYSKEQLDGHSFIIIEDQAFGSPYMSVTNDIENVVAEICEIENMPAEDWHVIYLDSDGIWDGWDTTHETFIPLQVQSNWRDAARKLLKLINEQK